MLKYITARYQVPDQEWASAEQSFERFNEYSVQNDLGVIIEGCLGDIPEIESDGPFSNLKQCFNVEGSIKFSQFSLFIDFGLMSNLYKQFRKGHTHILPVFNHKMENCPNNDWHAKLRKGEVYGFRKSNEIWCCSLITTNPLSKIEKAENITIYLDYIIRHEIGHYILNMDYELPEDAEDCVMKPLRFADDFHLATKNVEYTPEQIAKIRSNKY